MISIAYKVCLHDLFLCKYARLSVEAVYCNAKLCASIHLCISCLLEFFLWLLFYKNLYILKHFYSKYNLVNVLFIIVKYALHLTVHIVLLQDIYPADLCVLFLLPHDAE